MVWPCWPTQHCTRCMELCCLQFKLAVIGQACSNIVYSHHKSTEFMDSGVNSFFFVLLLGTMYLQLHG
jgi:hypothetical protein